MSEVRPDPGPVGSDLAAGWGDPTRAARIRLEKSGFLVEATVPAAHTSRLLDAVVVALAAAGAVVCPVLTVRAVPPDFPTWAAVALVAGQIGLLGVLALVARRR
ncbi:hypothetical protein IOD16_11620 [Saccharothrix sp. 6-C]|uniref:hypothetical protein n=1 Tax=Saccharothrix sp. 6-C TaxID=2781735 RepID=UPI001916D8DA|nr:hypothetical protein [Saccharothrix sp. 6-C]QQQ79013.1 hypothetical protein IOD16_11620 [Saccharothrix sp. 6-C]